jgi:TRAP-type C4-dicarboxylate transport system permease small subunit
MLVHIKKLNAFLFAACKFMIMVVVPIMTVIVIAQVIMRYVFKSAFIWVEEAARYLLIWISCLGSAYAAKKNMHISVLFINEKLTGHVKLSVNTLIRLSVLAFFVLCVVCGVMLALSEWEQISPGMGIRMTWVFLSIPIGFGLMALFTLETLIEEISKFLSNKEFLL